MNASPTYLAVLAAVTLWCLLIVLPPLAGLTVHSDFLPRVAYTVCAPACHQLDARSLHLGGIKFAVCARCTGIYAGFALAALLAAFARIRFPRRERAAWIVVVSPMLLDVLLDACGVRDATLASRLCTGAVFGIGAGVLLVPYMVQGLRELYRLLPLPTLRAHHELNT